MNAKVAKFLLCKVLGWKMLLVEPPREEKCVVLGVPHTCIADFFIFFLYTRAMGDRMNVFVKKEFFKWPLGPILKSLGAIPVNRAHGAGILKEYIRIFKEKEHIHLALSPEGTRKPVAHWKLGFHAIAHESGVPVYLGHFEWARKEISYGPRFEVSDDAEADLRKIQSYYKSFNPQGKHPDRVAYLK
ncbi:MAG: 1-acyl-sn-glycerol-3-phosphate acyltransferase [Bacteroidales bacterium]|nr:1-acyl-sn-glycerol-3-phosphate acyltransferase [Candidatus Cacconaster merdequi]